MEIQDHFSKQATLYARFRPIYPGAFFDHLATITPDRELAWDCGTGNGQAAVELAGRYRRVIATDTSAEQIKNAFPHPKVDYRVERAEKTSISSSSVDLTTAGTAVHWFDLDPFYAEVRRVSKSGAVIAVWAYHLPEINLVVDRSLAQLYWDTLGGYWPEPIRFLEEGYRTLPFPFKEIQSPEFYIEAQWDLNNMLGFIASWSATRKYIEQHGEESFRERLRELALSWGEPNQVRLVNWRLFTRIGLVSR